MNRTFKIGSRISMHIEPEDYLKYSQKLIEVADKILRECKNLDKVCFMDCGGTTLVIGGCYPNNGCDCNKTLFTWATLDEAADEFIRTWNPDGQKAWDSFISDIERYGAE